MAFSYTSRTLSLALAGLALSVTACADVGSGSPSGDGAAAPSPGDQSKIICQSIRTTIEKDLKAGNEEAVAAGVEGAKSVKGCDVSDLVPAASATPSAG